SIHVGTLFGWRLTAAREPPRSTGCTSLPLGLGPHLSMPYRSGSTTTKARPPSVRASQNASAKVRTDLAGLISRQIRLTPSMQVVRLSRWNRHPQSRTGRFSKIGHRFLFPFPSPDEVQMRNEFLNSLFSEKRTKACRQTGPARPTGMV